LRNSVELLHLLPVHARGAILRLRACDGTETSASIIASEIIRLILFIPFLPPKLMRSDFTGRPPRAVARGNVRDIRTLN
jgi:hypothetical protein